jgi:Ferredoxin-like domain in Api92-like protein
MPNWCYNSLLVAGEPEAVEEFRIVNAQHTHIEKYTNQPRGVVQAIPGQPSRLVFYRAEGDLSFTAVTKEWGEESWGTKWDVDGEVKLTRHDRGSWKLPNHGVTMDRLLDFRFDTAWKPPTDWFAAAAKAFPELKLTLSYAEASMDIFGVLEAQKASFDREVFHQTGRSEPKTIDVAGTRARKSMPLHRKPPALLKAIWGDDEKTVKAQLSKKPVSFLDEEVKSRWSALFHAAHAGSVGVANALMDALVKEKKTPQAIPLGGGRAFSLADVCTDVHTNCSPELASGRQKILTEAYRRWPEMKQAPLASGLPPLSLAVTYQMDPIVQALFTTAPLVTRHPDGRLNGVIPSLIRYYMTDEGDMIGDLFSTMDHKKREEFGRDLVRGILHASRDKLLGEATPTAARLFFKLGDNGFVSKEDMAIASGQMPLNSDGNSGHVGPDFKSIVNAELAMRAVNAMMGKHQDLKV